MGPRVCLDTIGTERVWALWASSLSWHYASWSVPPRKAHPKGVLTVTDHGFYMSLWCFREKSTISLWRHSLGSPETLGEGMKNKEHYILRLGYHFRPSIRPSPLAFLIILGHKWNVQFRGDTSAGCSKWHAIISPVFKSVSHLVSQIEIKWNL